MKLRLRRMTPILFVILLTVSSGQFTNATTQQDLGVDVGVVNTLKANLREYPSTNAPVVRQIRQSDYVVLIDREHVDGWYNVIHVDSGVEGWIHGDLIDVRWTRSRKTSNPFTAERVDSYSNPEIYVSNDSDRTITLTIGSSRYSIPSYSKQTITVASGTYKFVGSAARVIPLMGTKTWERGYRYTWRFWIETRRR